VNAENSPYPVELDCDLATDQLNYQCFDVIIFKQSVC